MVMKNSLSGSEYRKLSEKAFYRTSIILFVAYAFQLVAEMLGGSLLLICLLISGFITVAAYVFSFTGFKNLKNANALEDTAYPNTGKNFSVLNIVFCFIFAVLSLVLVFVVLSTSMLEKSGEINALKNAKIVFGIVYGLVNVFSITTVIALYIYRIFNIEKVERRQNNFTLFTALFLLMSLCITVVANVYYYGSSADDTVLVLFAGLLRIASYIVMIVFFKKRK